jgi:hypothetical protein
MSQIVAHNFVVPVVPSTDYIGIFHTKWKIVASETGLSECVVGLSATMRPNPAGVQAGHHRTGCPLRARALLADPTAGLQARARPAPAPNAWRGPAIAIARGRPDRHDHHRSRREGSLLDYLRVV